MLQMELFAFDYLSDAGKQQIFEQIKRHYWVIRNCRKTAIHDARRRKYYRLIEGEKKRLMLSGVPKREILDYLACCRLTCGRTKVCPYCRGEFRQIYARIQHHLG